MLMEQNGDFETKNELESQLKEILNGNISSYITLKQSLLSVFPIYSKELRIKRNNLIKVFVEESALNDKNEYAIALYGLLQTSYGKVYPRNIPRAYKYIEKSASHLNPIGIVELANVLSEDSNKKQNLQRALLVLERAIEHDQNNYYAHFEIGNIFTMLENAYQRDKHWQIALTNGFVDVNGDLATFSYFRGDHEYTYMYLNSIPQKYASNKNYLLGIYHEYGFGVLEVDYISALKYYLISAVSNCGRAVESIERFENTSDLELNNIVKQIKEIFFQSVKLLTESQSENTKKLVYPEDLFIELDHAFKKFKTFDIKNLVKPARLFIINEVDKKREEILSIPKKYVLTPVEIMINKVYLPIIEEQIRKYGSEDEKKDILGDA